MDILKSFRRYFLPFYLHFDTSLGIHLSSLGLIISIQNGFIRLIYGPESVIGISDLVCFKVRIHLSGDTASLYTVKTSRCPEHFAKRDFSVKSRVGARFFLKNRVPHRGILHEHLIKKL